MRKRIWGPVNASKYYDGKHLSKSFPEGWMYVGRGVKDKGLKASPLANRWSSRRNANAIIVKDKATAVENCRRWLWEQIKAGNSEVLEELRKVRANTVMVCHCNDDICHSKVVWKAAKWLREQEL